MITATNSGGTDHTPVAAGTYPARCFSMIHIGTTEETIMGETKWLNKVRITWELPTETKVFNEEKGEQPYVISKEFTLSMNEKANLRKFLEGWRGKGFSEDEAKSFDITVLLGKPCMLSVIHKTSKKGNVFAEISSCSAMPKGFVCPPQVNDTLELNYTDHWSNIEFSKLPQFIKDKMVSSKEFQAMMNPEVVDATNKTEDHLQDMADELPF